MPLTLSLTHPLPSRPSLPHSVPLTSSALLWAFVAELVPGVPHLHCPLLNAPALPVKTFCLSHLRPISHKHLRTMRRTTHSVHMYIQAHKCMCARYTYLHVHMDTHAPLTDLHRTHSEPLQVCIWGARSTPLEPKGALSQPKTVNYPFPMMCGHTVPQEETQVRPPRVPVICPAQWAGRNVIIGHCPAA